jgi:hypothetical protein
LTSAGGGGVSRIERNDSIYKNALLAVFALSLFALAMPAVAAPDWEPENQDFGDGEAVSGGQMCWECVPSYSQGLVCRRDYIGYHGCNKGWLYTTNPDGSTDSTPTCHVIPYGFCVTWLP